jgi:hypothetical protein
MKIKEVLATKPAKPEDTRIASLKQSVKNAQIALKQAKANKTIKKAQASVAAARAPKQLTSALPVV